MIILEGEGICPGIVMGNLHYIDYTDTKVPEYKIANIKAELMKYEAAKEQARRQLKLLSEESKQLDGEDKVGVMDVHICELDEPEFNSAVIEAIENIRINAIAAVKNAGQKSGFTYIASRIINNLNSTGQQYSQDKVIHNDPFICASHNFSLEKIAKIKNTRALGFITSGGADGSQEASAARHLKIPAVVGINNPNLQNYDGAFTIVDGSSGMVYINPTRNIIRGFKYKMAH